MAIFKKLKEISGLERPVEDAKIFKLGAREVRGKDAEPTLKFKEGQTVLEVVLAHRIPIATACGGMGTCGTCRIEVLEAPTDPTDLPERNEVEDEFARDRGFAPAERLACQVEACAGLRFQIMDSGVNTED